MNNFNRTKKANPWNKNSSGSKKIKENVPNQKISSRSENKFKEAQSKLQAAVQKHIGEYESSSDEEETLSNEVIGTIIKYYSENNVHNDSIQHTQRFLQDSIQYAASICLICMSRIKREDSLWNCTECYCGFHLMCIQRWSKDTIVQQKQTQEEQMHVKIIKVAWSCPKCRHEYDPNDIPSKYVCYCRKVINPTFTPLLAPHSCGETCGKQLKPICSHTCVLLCHPGPCPPCPKTVMVTCHCGSELPRLQRCCQKEWSCGNLCNKPLLCGKHSCSSLCHSGDCPQCPKKSIQNCLCGLSKKLRNCTTPQWQCEKICNKPLACGNHNCVELCHSGDCEPCILSKPRTCPCGKTKYNLPCTEETPTCGDTCGKLLECGEHICNQRCHKDKCSPCVETITKSCRCGLHSKEVQCQKVYTCETKCKRVKDCNKHPCNRKCCDGNCPPCEKPCGRTLSCGNHKCGSVCHRGPCYPCNQTETIFCRCGETSLIVPCGRKYKTKPPKCQKLCNIPPVCHHTKRENHRCHFGECPACKQICNKKHVKCAHVCPAPCHSAVVVKIDAQIGSMPWEQTKPQFEKKALDCPDCIIPVSVTCLGEHETSDWPCHISKPSSCHRQCGRLLECKNHFCSFTCHKVEDSENNIEAGSNCENCENPCTKSRPDGCQHSCLQSCHPDKCPPCKQMIRIACHCRLTQKYIYCYEWTSPVTDKKEIQSCGNQCPFNLKCGHRCRVNCHPPPCPEQPCKKKIKIFCDCKRLKKEFQCESVQKKEAIVLCDDECFKKKEEDEKAKKAETEKRLKEEEIKNKIEMEKYQKMFHGKKKNKERRNHNEIEEKSFLQKYSVAVVSVSILLLSLIMYFIFY